MRRREFIAALGGGIAWSFAARAQQPRRTRRVGFLTASFNLDDPELQTRNSAFVEALRELGWGEGSVQVEFRSGGGKTSDIRKHAAELVALADVVLANGGQTVAALQDVSRTVPIVFVSVPDPVGAGFVDTLSHPGSNATGFSNFEYGMGAKWLELLREFAPTVRQVAVVRDPSTPAGSGQWGAIQLAASSIGVELSSINSRGATAAEMERAFAAFARRSNGGLILTSNLGAAARRDVFVSLAARHKLPAVYPSRYWVAAGGLVGYGINVAEQYRQAAGYVDRILKGEKPADLPVQQPVKYELVNQPQSRQGAGV